MCLKVCVESRLVKSEQQTNELRAYPLSPSIVVAYMYVCACDHVLCVCTYVCMYV